MIIPTRGRAAMLERTLAAVADQAAVPGGCEVVVVENDEQGPVEEIVSAAQARASNGLVIRFLREPALGPAAARNKGICEAQGKLLLFLGDDTAPVDRDLFSAHVRAHATLREGRVAVLGKIRWRQRSPSPLMRWLDQGGVQFAYESLTPGPVAMDRYFYSSHVSVPATTLRDAGLFDPRFTSAAVEDLELGWRLKQDNVQLVYRPDLVVEHDHPTDYGASLRRMERIGEAAASLRRLRPDVRLMDPGDLAILKAPVVRAASALLLGRRELASLPRPIREARWRVTHLNAFYAGYRRAHTYRQAKP